MKNKIDVSKCKFGHVYTLEATGEKWQEGAGAFRVIYFNKCFIEINDDGSIFWCGWWDSNEINNEGYEFEIYDCGEGRYEAPQRECQCNHKEPTAASEEHLKAIAFDFLYEKGKKDLCLEFIPYLAEKLNFK